MKCTMNTAGSQPDGASRILAINRGENEKYLTAKSG